MIDPRDTVDIPDDREPEHHIPDAVCDVQTAVGACASCHVRITQAQAAAEPGDGGLHFTIEGDGSWYCERCVPIAQPLQRFYFTFGQAYNLRNNYVVVEAVDRTAAVAEFTEVRRDCSQSVPEPERCWAFTYDEERFAGQPEQYGLTEVPIDATIWMER